MSLVHAEYQSDIFAIRKTLKPHKEVLGGFFGGACGIFCTHPLDTIRTRAQVMKGTKNPSYMGIVRDVIKHRGVLGLYAGVFPPVFFRGIGFAMNRSGYAFAKKYTDNSAILGAVAGAVNSIADTPIFCLKNRVQCSNGKFKETLSHYCKMGYQIFRKEGLRGLYSGHIPNLILESVSYALFYVVYDPMIAGGYPPWLCGVCAVLACWPMCYPLDVLRTRSQITPKRTKWSRDYFTFRYFLREMWAQPVNRWFPGMSLTLVRAAPRYGVAMAVCESIKNSLED